ncbi:4-diphosphocytidyl-2-C-methyl-D-erythritol kinase [Desulfonispora thiosulfatigenes DSM 11270]|uniref:4-diphosphocytidyl-2-C-methyl-D-erythritol kinase n=1 Tax=Desulfonispora thiosulfatigenes DSM 11270 TaxID=656914 RepID=A0A1W1UZZ9_DESTI|nr:4-(cytidine 5'-diphospho)-2-C-methyl-D-erythritol kinase [Desulfonispora thiosulfatigenes]SMB86675.1 4-diphosphocytidyl-2-C-methyl-D-erythritol kinase [Desulfonispora thiosulfatigenes DSM 11270]
MRQAKVKTYAKINMVLNCLYKRDDGYHEISSIMQAISLHDNINLKPAGEIILNSNSTLIPLDEKNFAFKAAQLVISKYPSIKGVEIYIDKKIPIEAGLAGGSTNAAGVILGMNKLFNLKMTTSEMIEVAEQIGSDVPFGIIGPTALSTGRGTNVSPIPEAPLLWVVLLKPDFGVSTPKVYSNMKEQMFEKTDNIKGFLGALERKDQDYILGNLVNTLEKSTFALYPKVQEIKDFFIRNTKHSLMAGSGPTVFALFPNEIEAINFKDSIPPDYGKAYLAQTIDSKEIHERVIIDEKEN